MLKTANRRMTAPTKRIQIRDLWKQACRNADNDVFVGRRTCMPAKRIASLSPGMLLWPNWWATELRFSAFNPAYVTQQLNRLPNLVHILALEVSRRCAIRDFLLTYVLTYY